MSTNSHERTCAPLKLHPRNFTQPHSTAYYTKLGCSVAQYSPPILTLATLNPSNRQKPRHVALRSRVASGAAHRPPRKQTRHLRLLARVRAQHQIGGPMRSPCGRLNEPKSRETRPLFRRGDCGGGCGRSGRRLNRRLHDAEALEEQLVATDRFR